MKPTRVATKTERRALLRQKKKRVTGGGFAAQAKRDQVNKGYQGLAKGIKKRIISKTKIK